MVTIENIDIFDKFKSEQNVALFHCANSFCTMGTGIALDIKKKYPEAYAADCQTTKGDRNKLGKYSFSWVDESEKIERIIFNLYGQYAYGRDSRKLNYEAIYSSMDAALQCLKEFGAKCKILIPYKIGCSNAGGNWNIVYCMIKELSEQYNVDIVICNKD